MTFKKAMVAARKGHNVRRSGWNKSKQSVIQYAPGTAIYMKHESQEEPISWTPDQEDMNAKDWEFVK